MIAVECAPANSGYIVLFTVALIFVRGTRLMNVYYVYYLLHFVLFFFKVRVLLLHYTYVILL